MIYLHRQDIIHRDLKSSNGKGNTDTTFLHSTSRTGHIWVSIRYVAAVLQTVYLFSHAVLLTSELKAKVCSSVVDM